jgi:hypothetical protein
MSPVASKHYRVKELSELWGLCETTISNLFRNEPGVLKLGSERRAILSIPESVALHVHERLGHRAATVAVVKREAVYLRPRPTKHMLRVTPPRRGRNPPNA